MKKLLLLLVLTTYFGCATDPKTEEYQNPTTISGVVKNGSGEVVSNAKVSLSTAQTYEGVLTNEQGQFTLKDFPSGKHTLKVEHIGYETYLAEVPSAINGYSTINPVLTLKTYNVPTVKPLSTGAVRINNKKLEVDFDGDGIYQPYYVKGVSYSITPIGGKPITSALEDRSIQHLKAMNANTVRTYGVPGKTMLTKMAAQNIRVIAGFWVETSYDLSQPAIRQQVKDDFAKMVVDLKNNPGVLMWNLGNEQNYQNGNTPYWYSLCQELAIVAYQIEGEKYHPVCINNGNIYNIGNVSMNADDAALSYVDLWATNIYEINLTPKFDTFRTKSNKPLVITEYGIDALDNRTKQEYESTQAAFDSLNWSQIISASNVVVGATVFEYTDEWWKAGDDQSHDYGGYATGAHPDGYSNEEWWGVIAVTPDANNDGFDEWRPRLVYYMFQRNWK
ncbi:MAG: DUF2012 domain-containing protein [Ignavibacteriaceae bacterium]|jgi:hypothetical protein